MVNGNLIVYNLKDYKDSQKMFSGANVISRPCGQQLSFMPGTFDTVAQLLATIKRTIGLPHFSFRELKSSGKYEILFGKYEGITFPREETPSINGFTGIPDGNGIHIGYKMNPNADRFMKSDDTKAYYGEFLADLCAGKHLIFIYTNIIECQYVVTLRLPLCQLLIQNIVWKTVVFVSLNQLIG